MTVKSAYDEIYSQIAPNGLFLQRGFTSEGLPGKYISKEDLQGTRGSPVEWAIMVLAVLIICEFLKGFFGELGKEAAKKSLEKIARVMRSSREVKEKDVKNIENLVKSIDMSDVVTEQKEQAYLCGEQEIRRVLIQAGMPSYRAEPIASKSARTIRGEIIGSCLEFE